LYLVTPTVIDPEAFSNDLAVILGIVDFAAVLLRLGAADEATLLHHIKTLAPVAQNREVALVTDGYPALALRGGADGAHLSGIAAFRDALEILKPDRIAGAGCLDTRHDTMLAAESGADYVMFGEPCAGVRPPFHSIMERVGWWAELFEIPCVGYAASPDEIAALAAAGADFIAIDFPWTDARGPQAALADAVTRLQPAETVP
jgi:thiamine-phosphate pyrophosphorylase